MTVASEADVLRLVVDQLDDGIIVCDKQLTRVIYSNRAGKNAWGTLVAEQGGPADLFEAASECLAATPGGPCAIGRCSLQLGSSQKFFLRAKRLNSFVVLMLTRFVARQSDIDTVLRLRYGLSLRERQIVLLLRQGLRNRQVANKLGLTEGTVKQYLNRIYPALGVAHRPDLMSMLERLGSGPYVDAAHVDFAIPKVRRA